MKNSRESVGQSSLSIEWVTRHWRELLAVGLGTIAIWTLYQTFTPSCGLMDPKYSDGVFCSVNLTVDERNRVNHGLHIGVSHEFRWPDGTIVVPEGQLFIAIQSCPSILTDDGGWMTTACSVIDIIR